MPLAIFCSCTAWFVLDLVRNTEDRFFHDVAQIAVFTKILRSWPCSRESPPKDYDRMANSATLIRLLLKEQSDLGLHSLSRYICSKDLGSLGHLSHMLTC